MFENSVLYADEFLRFVTASSRNLKGDKQMKKIVLGGFIFVGGTVMFSVGTLGFADVNVQAHYMQLPQYIGMAAMIAG